MARKLTIRDLPVNGKKILIRADLNVPLDDHQNITDDTRLVAALDTIKYIVDRAGSVILMSHLGRPKNGRDPALSLVPVAKRLSELLNKKVILAPDCVGPQVEEMVQTLQPGDVLLLENLRFYPAEEKPESDPLFAQNLAKLGDFYVNDAFGTAHRVHASTATMAQYFPRKAAAGLLMEKEINFLGETLLNPNRPFYALIGGAKISTKIGVLKALINKADGILLGGGMTFTFLKAKGINIGTSLCENDSLDLAKELMAEAEKNHVPLYLPTDILIADSTKPEAQTKVVETSQGVPDGFMGVDIGPKTVESFIQVLKQAKTVLWNGPLGIFEVPAFANGTLAIAKALANLDAITIVGGGDSIAAVNKAGVAKAITHISTGGGATLEYVEYGTLPGIEALSEAIENKEV